MSKAEERALEAYPIDIKATQLFGTCDVNLDEREAFREGYQQAEKDLAPLIEVATIVYEAWNGGTMDDVRRGMDELEKRFNEAKR